MDPNAPTIKTVSDQEDIKLWESFLTGLSSAFPIAGKIKQLLHATRGREGYPAILDFWKSNVERVPVENRMLFQNLVIRPIQRRLGRIPLDMTEEKTEIGEALRVLGAYNKKELQTEKAKGLMVHGLPKGVRPSQIKTKAQYSPMVLASLDKIIQKLAAMNQPLGIRPDYGTTGDVSERLKEIKDKLSMMFKPIPVMDYDQPQPVVLEGIADYDDEDRDEGDIKVIVLDDYDAVPGTPEVVKKGPPCCTECGQEIPAVMSRSAKSMDSKFKKMRDMLKNKELKEAQIEEVRRALEAVYQEYSRWERDRSAS